MNKLQQIKMSEMVTFTFMEGFNKCVERREVRSFETDICKRQFKRELHFPTLAPEGKNTDVFK